MCQGCNKEEEIWLIYFLNVSFIHKHLFFELNLLRLSRHLNQFFDTTFSSKWQLHKRQLHICIKSN